jgi:hypothetical protein
VGRVQAFTGGYGHRIWSRAHASAELGAQATIYNTPDWLKSLYGDHPAGFAALLKLQLGKR